MTKNTESGYKTTDPPVIILATSWVDVRLVGGIMEYAQTQGWHVLNLDHYSMKVLPHEARVQGVIYLAFKQDQALFEDLMALKVPSVQLEQYHPDAPSPCVIQDQAAIGRLAARHFLDRKFESFAYVSFAHGSHRERGLSYRRTIEDAGFECSHIIFPTSEDSLKAFEDERDILRKHLESMPHPVALFVFYDEKAVRIIEMCFQLGYEVPTQVAILGCDNNPLDCDYASIPLSSIDVRPHAQGRAAAELLDQMMHGTEPPAEPLVILPKGVVTRRSTNIVAVSDILASRALRYIWDHFQKSLTVEDVAQTLGVSRRKLERRFNKAFGHGVCEELIRCRMKHACEALRSNDGTISRIARESGFNSPEYFHSVFSRRMGCTPRAYRLSQA